MAIGWGMQLVVSWVQLSLRKKLIDHFALWDMALGYTRGVEELLRQGPGLTVSCISSAHSGRGGGGGALPPRGLGGLGWGVCPRGQLVVLRSFRENIFRPCTGGCSSTRWGRGQMPKGGGASGGRQGSVRE